MLRRGRRSLWCGIGVLRLLIPFVTPVILAVWWLIVLLRLLLVVVLRCTHGGAAVCQLASMRTRLFRCNPLSASYTL